MVYIGEFVTRNCSYCQRDLPWASFYVDRRNIMSSRCKECHGKRLQACAVCGREFEGKSHRRFCSDACRKQARPQTFKICLHCKRRFGPVDRLNRQYCSMACKHEAQRTGRTSVRKGIPEARRAWGLVAYHLKTGKLKKADACEACGTTERRLKASHSDYSRPRDVRWLCKSCHAKEDCANPKNATVRIALEPKGRWEEFTGRKAERIAAALSRVEVESEAEVTA